MNCSERPKRTVKIKSEEPLVLPRKWKDEEIRGLLECIMKYGHKNFEKLQECLPGRSLCNIKSFLRTVYDNAGKLCEGHPNLDSWISHCIAENTKETAWRDSIQLAQVLKCLAVDGLVENHPLPERCNGIHFTNAYQLIYQALMGYPIQPVNESTAAFVQETIAELTNEVMKQPDAIQNVKTLLHRKYISKKVNGKSENTPTCLNNTTNNSSKNNLKVYQRKKMKVSGSIEKEVPSLQIIVEANNKEETNFNSLKDFSVTIAGDDNTTETTVVNVAVPVSACSNQKISKEERELQQSTSYNPFNIPENWLEEPIYVNLIQKTSL